MKQKLFDALKAKFPGVNANVLNRIAEKLAKTVTTDEQVTTAVAGVTQEFIEIIESYGDSRATEAQQTKSSRATATAVRPKPNRQPYTPTKRSTG